MGCLSRQPDCNGEREDQDPGDSGTRRRGRQDVCSERPKEEVRQARLGFRPKGDPCKRELEGRAGSFEGWQSRRVVRSG